MHSLSSGERKGNSPNRVSLTVLRPMLARGCKPGLTKLRIGQGVTNRTLEEGSWNGPPQGVRVPYSKGGGS